MESKQIYEWLDKQKYQTEYEETGEYKMYFAVDMPKILNDFLQHVKNLPNELKGVSNNEQKEKVNKCKYCDEEINKGFNFCSHPCEVDYERR